MKIIEPKVELLDSLNISPESHIARCARVCYNKENKASNQETDEKMVKGLIKNNHLSMLRHASVYYVFPNKEAIPEELFSEYANRAITADNKLALVSTNKQFVYERFANRFIDFSPLKILEVCQNSPKLFSAFRLTFCITTQIATSRELNRKSPNNIAERSTRYCSSKDGLEICKPWWYDNIEFEKKDMFYRSWINAENSYKSCLQLGMKPEDARGLLPLDTATKVIYTYSVQEWQHILDLRLYDKTGKAHPNCKVVMAMAKNQINAFAKAHHIDYEV